MSRGQFRHSAQAVLLLLVPLCARQRLPCYFRGDQTVVKKIFKNTLHAHGGPGRVQRYRLLIAPSGMFHPEMELIAMNEETKETAVLEFAA